MRVDDLESAMCAPSSPAPSGPDRRASGKRAICEPHFGGGNV